MSTSRMSFGTPNKLNQSTDSNTFLPSYFFPSPAAQSLRDQEDTYLARPQRLTTVSSSPSRERGEMKVIDIHRYFLAHTPYKSPVTPHEKSPASDLPPTRSVYQVIKEKQTVSLADTSMGEADTSMGGTAGTRLEGGGSEPGIDWERDARGPFAYSGAHGAYAGSAAQGAYAGALVPGPFGGVETQRGYFQSPAAIRPQYGAQSPPFARTFQTEEDRPQTEAIWLTVFGFPPNQAASTFVLQQFQVLGDVVEYNQPIGTNWLHVCYMLRAHADRALAKNGKLMGEYMLGVVPRPLDNAGRDLLPTVPNTISNKDPNKLYERDAALLPPKDQSWLKSIISFTFG